MEKRWLLQKASTSRTSGKRKAAVLDSSEGEGEHDDERHHQKIR